MSVFSDLTAVLVQRLEQAPAVCPNVYRSRWRALPKGDTLAVVVSPERADVDASINAGGIASRQVVMRVECYARANASEAGDEVVDGLLTAVHQRLLDAAWPPSRYLSEVGVVWEFGAAEDGVCCAVLSLMATLTTATDSLNG